MVISLFTCKKTHTVKHVSAQNNTYSKSTNFLIKSTHIWSKYITAVQSESIDQTITNKLQRLKNYVSKLDIRHGSFTLMPHY